MDFEIWQHIEPMAGRGKFQFFLFYRVFTFNIRLIRRG